MSKAQPLTSCVPVYRFKKIIHAEDSAPSGSAWVDEIKDLGNKGEKIVEQYLRRKYNTKRVIKNPDDSAGYDFDVDIPCVGKYIEVKITHTKKHHFYISHNEIKTAKEKGQDYHIYLICLDNNRSGTIYIIQNPFSTLALSNIFGTTNSNEIASLRIETVEVKITNFEELTAIRDSLCYEIIEQVLDITQA